MNSTPIKIKAIITGVTGMVGEGVLYECLQDPQVEAILTISRKPHGYSHPKLKSIIHENFFDLSSIENELVGYNACFFCLGVSSVGMKEDKYRHLTYDLTMHVAETLSRLNKDMTFCYVSGASTDSSEKGKLMWARVKGKTENDLMKLPFKSVVTFRPGFMKATKGLKYTLPVYKWIAWLYPIGRVLYPRGFCTLKELGLAMIKAPNAGFDRKVLEGDEIVSLTKYSSAK